MLKEEKLSARGRRPQGKGRTAKERERGESTKGTIIGFLPGRLDGGRTRPSETGSAPNFGQASDSERREWGKAGTTLWETLLGGSDRWIFRRQLLIPGSNRRSHLELQVI